MQRGGGRATVVVVPRDRWTQAPATLAALLGRTDARHPVVYVEGATPGAVRRRLAAVGDGRVSFRSAPGHLPGNRARNLGAEGATTPWVAFVDNDTVPSPGWVDALVAEGEARDAAVAYPAYLVPDGGVHGLGCDLDVTDDGRIRETHHHYGEPWEEVRHRVAPTRRIQPELHAVAVRTELLHALGGLDEALLSWFDHMDLALHLRRLGAEAWFTPAATATYRFPGPWLDPRDLPSFALRWGEGWYRRSFEHLVATWSLDPSDPSWENHRGYRVLLRHQVPTPWRRVNAALDRVVLTPVERRLLARS